MSKKTKSAPVTTLVPNAEGTLEVVSIETAPVATKDTKSTKRVKKELDVNDPFMKQTIDLKRLENPKRKGSKSAARFALYTNGMTVAEFLKAGGTRGDINWDVAHEHIELIPHKE